MLPPFVTKYLQPRAIQGSWRITGCTETGFAGAVVIPALAEYENLFDTLQSLAANPPELLARFLILVVVNHREDALPGDKEDNYETLKQLAALDPELAPLQLAWVDAASPGLEMPAKAGGVGLARKIGLDLALTRLDFTAQSPLLVSLDADTLVEPSYLPALVNHFRHSGCGGAVIPFCHRPGDSPELRSRPFPGRLSLRLPYRRKRHGLHGASLYPDGRDEPTAGSGGFLLSPATAPDRRG
jgi:cellulose synthase/poly-beta-1,6-N-acetylglucosamine synthase-like glycosyltransferase